MLKKENSRVTSEDSVSGGGGSYLSDSSGCLPDDERFYREKTVGSEASFSSQDGLDFRDWEDYLSLHKEYSPEKVSTPEDSVSSGGGSYVADWSECLSDDEGFYREKTVGSEASFSSQDWGDDSGEVSLRQCDKFLTQHPAFFTSDRKFMLKTVKALPWVLVRASDALQGDEELLIAALRKENAVLRLLSDKVRNDQTLMTRVAEETPWALIYASQGIQTDRTIMLKAVGKDGHLLQRASIELRKDREVVLAAVTHSGAVLGYASDLLKDDRAVVWAAMFEGNPFPEAFYWASARLKGDLKLLLMGLCYSARTLNCASDEFKNGGLKRHMLTVAQRWSTPYSSFLLFLYGLSSAYDDEKHAEKASAVRLIKLRKIGKYHQLGVLSLIATFAGVRMESEFVEEEGQCALIERRSDWSVVNAAANKLGWQSLLNKASTTESSQAEVRDQSALSR